ncbi:MAG: hypothetical protein Q8P95_05265 [bacterium]|nr:hypothetical protein [bacterium]
MSPDICGIGMCDPGETAVVELTPRAGRARPPELSGLFALCGQGFTQDQVLRAIARAGSALHIVDSGAGVVVRRGAADADSGQVTFSDPDRLIAEALAELETVLSGHDSGRRDEHAPLASLNGAFPELPACRDRLREVLARTGNDSSLARESRTLLPGTTGDTLRSFAKRVTVNQERLATRARVQVCLVPEEIQGLFTLLVCWYNKREALPEKFLEDFLSFLLGEREAAIAGDRQRMNELVDRARNHLAQRNYGGAWKEMMDALRVAQEFGFDGGQIEGFIARVEDEMWEQRGIEKIQEQAERAREQILAQALARAAALMGEIQAEAAAAKDDETPLDIVVRIADRWEQAADCYDQAGMLFDASFQRFRLGEEYLSSKGLAKALPYLERALREFTEQEDLIMIGRCHALVGRAQVQLKQSGGRSHLDNAIRLLGAALDSEATADDDPEILKPIRSDLADACAIRAGLYGTGEPRKAIGLLERAAELYGLIGVSCVQQMLMIAIIKSQNGMGERRRLSAAERGKKQKKRKEEKKARKKGR